MRVMARFGCGADSRYRRDAQRRHRLDFTACAFECHSLRTRSNASHRPSFVGTSLAFILEKAFPVRLSSRNFGAAWYRKQHPTFSNTSAARSPCSAPRLTRQPHRSRCQRQTWIARELTLLKLREGPLNAVLRSMVEPAFGPAKNLGQVEEG